MKAADVIKLCLSFVQKDIAKLDIQIYHLCKKTWLHKLCYVFNFTDIKHCYHKQNAHFLSHTWIVNIVNANKTEQKKDLLPTLRKERHFRRKYLKLTSFGIDRVVVHLCPEAQRDNCTNRNLCMIYHFMHIGLRIKYRNWIACGYIVVQVHKVHQHRWHLSK